MSVLVLDAGNSIIKAKIARREFGELTFPHAIRELTKSDYLRIISRQISNGSTKDYVCVNEVPYVVGESAERHGLVTQRSGASRYTRDYYGVLTAIALGKFYSKSREVAVFGSHAPGDEKFRGDLMRSVLGEWIVEMDGNIVKFNVRYSNTFDEPLGGLMNVLLTEDGQHYQHPTVGDGRSLVIDIGGYTTDFLAVNPGAKVDYSLARSVPLGIQMVINDFEESFRANHPEDVKDISVLPANKVRKAISNGVFVGGGRTIDCKDEVDEATNLFLNRFADTYHKYAGGALAWDTIILTGGGSALLYDKLLPILKHGNVMIADTMDELHLANVRGGLKLWRLYVSHGMI